MSGPHPDCDVLSHHSRRRGEDLCAGCRHCRAGVNGGQRLLLGNGRQHVRGMWCCPSGQLLAMREACCHWGPLRVQAGTLQALQHRT